MVAEVIITRCYPNNICAAGHAERMRNTVNLHWSHPMEPLPLLARWPA
jgi:hypothetical protein